MDKNRKDLQNCKIYQVRNSVNDDLYIGGTSQKLCKRMAIHRQYSVSHTGLFYDEMRRLGREQFYIELIEKCPCDSNEQLTARVQYYIKERGTLNKVMKNEQADSRHMISDLTVLVQDLSTRLLHVNGKLESLRNTDIPPPATLNEEDTKTTTTTNEEIRLVKNPIPLEERLNKLKDTDCMTKDSQCLLYYAISEYIPDNEDNEMYVFDDPDSIVIYFNARDIKLTFEYGTKWGTMKQQINSAMATTTKEGF
jgi:hypothetical protein